jgi:hypothetical protein
VKIGCTLGSREKQGVAASIDSYLGEVAFEVPDCLGQRPEMVAFLEALEACRVA